MISDPTTLPYAEKIEMNSRREVADTSGSDEQVIPYGNLQLLNLLDLPRIPTDRDLTSLRALHKKDTGRTLCGVRILVTVKVKGKGGM
ncbi:hypothetical protein Y032_0004g1852 [Ancylostoma ceylanicum]|uniref:Uncharacterized protein n=1 Tax=Ancylostoma ceylanicum TaxID=53326 RepID=A0A016VTK6_9BILA|nr:hypothetical protein Y032_0004g1852 [Ancylostoma ceylanicum]